MLYRLRASKVKYQLIIGNFLWNFAPETPDIPLLNRFPLPRDAAVKNLSPQMYTWQGRIQGAVPDLPLSSPGILVQLVKTTKTHANKFLMR